ncbi:MAG TPA: shikimate kinase [Candidatus Eisenbacteria bacterium]|nr:shikimate kinase [Candidatus Eisenbacteria bacterium]
MATRAAPRVALIGLPGSGKSAVAPLLAARLGVAAADLDEAIERAAGRPVAAIFADAGEASFREAEARALAAALARDEGVVIACGGGVTTSEASRSLLRARATVVWLRISPALAARRLGPSGLAARPLIAAAGGAASEAAGAAALAALLAAREGHYATAADVVVETGGRTAEAAAEAAEAALRERWAGSAS